MTVTLEQIFTEARTARGYLPGEVSDETLRALYDLVKFGPTSGNCTPLRIVFARTAAARERLAACMNPGANQAKVQAAPVAAVLVHKGADPTVALALTLPTLLTPSAVRLGLPAPAAKLAGIGLAVAISATVALAPTSSRLAAQVALHVPDFHAAAGHAHGAVEYACAATVAGLCLAALLRSGLYGFVRTLESEPR